MTEEVKNEEIKQEIQHECFCRKRLKDVFVIALGSFIGVYCALSLFSAIHRPRFNPPPMYQYGMQYHHRIFPQDMMKYNKHYHGNFEKFKNKENPDIQKENLE